MDIIAHLEADHAKLSVIFERLEDTTTEATKTRTELLETIRRELEVHTTFEEDVLYPAIQAAADERGQDLTREAVAEHSAASDVLARLLEMPTDDEMWKATLTVLEESFTHHVDEEESELFPLARHLLDSETLITMGEQYAAKKAPKPVPEPEPEEPHHTQLIGMT